jgi:tagaturonate reductase
VVTSDVSPYRERKIRLLNGAHTIIVATALLSGCASVKDAMEHAVVGRYFRHVMLDELVPSVEAPHAERFAHETLERFAHPFVQHELFSITLQGTTKMRIRVIPSVVQYFAKMGRVPDGMAFGFAAYLLFMRGDLHEERRAAGVLVPVDEAGASITESWAALNGGGDAGLEGLVEDVCADEGLWGANLAALPGFQATVAAHLRAAHRIGVPAALEAFLRAGSGDYNRYQDRIACT